MFTGCFIIVRNALAPIRLKKYFMHLKYEAFLDIDIFSDIHKYALLKFWEKKNCGPRNKFFCPNKWINSISYSNEHPVFVFKILLKKKCTTMLLSSIFQEWEKKRERTEQKVKDCDLQFYCVLSLHDLTIIS